MFSALRRAIFGPCIPVPATPAESEVMVEDITPIYLDIETDRGTYRCHKCSQMRAGEIIHMPDGVGQFGDTGEHLVEVMRYHQASWNTHSSGWCVACVRKIIARNSLQRFFVLRRRG
jgi:hypothetical protein